MFQVPGGLGGSTRGLCGNYNGDPHDDKVGRTGQQIVSSRLFTEAWQIPGYPACQPVAVARQVQEKAFKICNIIRFPPFNLCQNIVEKNNFLSKCSHLTEKCLLKEDNDERSCK